MVNEGEAPVVGFARDQWDASIRVLGEALAAIVVLLAPCRPARAETLETALVKAYGNNPQLNAQRASVRATDEGVSKAQSGYRPKISASGEIGAKTSISAQPRISLTASLPATAHDHPGSKTCCHAVQGRQLNQMIFRFGRDLEHRSTSRKPRACRARELAQHRGNRALQRRHNLYGRAQRHGHPRLQRSNVDVLRSSFAKRATGSTSARSRAPTWRRPNSRLEGARSQVAAAEATLKADIATYRQIIGVEPKTLAPGRPIDRLCRPHSMSP